MRSPQNAAPGQNGRIKILCLGDVVGRPGREILKQALAQMRDRLNPDVVIVNGENSAGGLGIDPKTADEIRAAGVSVVTLGDHTWQRREIKAAMESRPWLIRPGNYPAGAPGKDHTVVTLSSGTRVGVFNLLGRVFMNAPLDCPFLRADSILKHELAECDVVVCDMHAEATSEKLALARYLDGRVSLVFGTHTHVQTADETILPGGTAFISDLGMCGSHDGVIGMDARVAIDRFLTGLPHAYQVAEGGAIVSGVVCDIDPASGSALAIQRVRGDGR